MQLKVRGSENHNDTKTKVKNNEKYLTPLEKRLLNIRLHLLQNTTRRTQPPSEPTLVFDPFLYLGGLKSLSNKVSLISLRMLLFHPSFCLHSSLDSSQTSKNNSHTFGRFHSTSKESHSTEYETFVLKSRR